MTDTLEVAPGISIECDEIGEFFLVTSLGKLWLAKKEVLKLAFWIIEQTTKVLVTNTPHQPLLDEIDRLNKLG